MNPQVKIEVIDKDGWRKEFSFQKSLFHIGSAAMNDLVLENARGGGVAARHAQLIALQDGSGYRLVNLGDTDILLNEAGDKRAAPHAVASVSDGNVIKMGDFTLIFHGEAMMVAAAPTDSRSSHIGLRLSLPRTKVAPHQNIAGVLAVANHGDKAGVQFDLDLEGLEPDCYNIEPAPLLPSGSEREVALRIFHQGDKPIAGEHTLTLRAVAPDAYPGEEATVTCVIQIQPFYKHTLQPAMSGQRSAVSGQPEGAATRVEDLLPPPVAARPAAPPPPQKPPVPLWEEAEPPVAKAAATPPTPEKQPALTLKAVPTPEVQPPSKAIPTPSPAEDWWTVPEAGSEQPSAGSDQLSAVSGQLSAFSGRPEVEREAPSPDPVELAVETEGEVVVEAPAAPPVETWEAAPETAASVAAVVEEPAAAIAVGEQPSSVSSQQSAVSEQLSAVGDEPLAVGEQPSAVSEQSSAGGEQQEEGAPSADDWWGAAEEPPTPEIPVAEIVPPTEAEPTPEAEVTPPKADDWWSEGSDVKLEQEDTPPSANADWWAA